MSDPVLDAVVEQAPAGLFGKETEPAPSGPYGLGIWKAAKLLDVETYAFNEKWGGYKLGLKVELKENMPYTIKFDLERTLLPNGHEVEEWKLEKEAKRREFLRNALSAVGFNREIDSAIDTEEKYNAIANVFRQQVGTTFQCKIVEDGKNVKGADGKWKREGNGYSRCAWMRPVKPEPEKAKEA